jgi:hypothetical protein
MALALYSITSRWERKREKHKANESNHSIWRRQGGSVLAPSLPLCRPAGPLVLLHETRGMAWKREELGPESRGRTNSSAPPIDPLLRR